MKISNNSNMGDIIINGKPYNNDVDIEIVDSKIYIGKKGVNKASLSIRIDKELFDEVDEVKEKLLTREEQIEYKKFVKLMEILLDIKEVYKKEYQDILFSIFFFITLKKRNTIA